MHMQRWFFSWEWCPWVQCQNSSHWFRPAERRKVSWCKWTALASFDLQAKRRETERTLSLFLSLSLCVTGIWAQALKLARQLLYHFCLEPPTYASYVAGMTGMCHHPWLIGRDRVLITFCLDWPQTMMPLISTSHIAGITGTCAITPGPERSLLQGSCQGVGSCIRGQKVLWAVATTTWVWKVLGDHCFITVNFIREEVRENRL
jgi:hypothetical protein